MKKIKSKIILLLLILIFFISSNIDISNNFLTPYNNNDKEDDRYSDKIPLTQSPISSSSNWWNSLYNYRIPINITNINTKNLPEGYSVNISVNTAALISDGKLRTDGYDLRILWYNSSNSAWLELDRVNESPFNTIDTRIWFKTQKIIDPGTSDTNYYLYYGNPNAFSPPMNKSKIYDFYDDFTQPDGIADGWTSLSGTWEVIDNEYQENSNLLDCTSLLNSYSMTNSSIEVRVKTNGSSFGVGVKFRYESDTSFMCAGLGYWDKEISFGKRNASGWYEIAFDGVDESNLFSDQWYNLKIESMGNHYKIYLDDILRIDTNHNDLLNNNGVGFLTWTTNTSFFDDLKIKLLMSSEPSLTLGNEEIYRHSSEEFRYYKIFTIDSSKVIGSTNLLDFPFLISIEDSDLNDHCQPDGNDIAFSNGTIWLDHEIELFNQQFTESHAKLVAWIRIPSLSPTTNTNITMYYGNSIMNSQENPSGVWNSNYKGVWHLKEDPSASKIKDSTSNSYHGISHGAMTSNNQMEGQIGGSIKLDGLNDYISLGSDSELKLTDAFTIEAWYSGIYNTTVDTRSPIYCSGFSYTDSIGIRIEAFHSNSGREARIAVGDGTTFGYITSDYEIKDNTWTHSVGTYDGSTLKLYINGTKQIDERVTNIAYNANNATIGINLDYTVQCYKGLIDELRLLSTTSSAEWIATEYNNQYEPNSFYSIGKENLVHKYLSHENYFASYKIITINHTQVSGDGVLLNFPLLLSIIDSDLRDQVQDDGDDIAFAKDNVWLAHEIEVFNFTYSSTESQLICWIRIPFLSGTNDTQFYMYYGNSTMNSQENPNGIYDINTFGVWHLSETGNGSVNEYKDSSAYNNNGQGGEGDSLFVPTRTSGIIGFAQDFNNLDGKYDLIDCGNNSIFDISGNQITMEAWIKHNITPQAHYYGIMNHKGWYDGYSLWIEQNSLKLAFNLPGDTHKLLSNQDITTNTWHHIVATYDGSYMRIYIDGVQDLNNLTKVNNIEPSSAEKNFWIGHGDQPKDKVWSAEYEGQIDEVRISNIARSADWIATEYNNQISPSNFYSIGNQVTQDTTPPDITINSPISNELFGLSAPTYSLTVIDVNLDSIWYSLNGGANSTPVSASGAIDETMWDALGNGTVIIRFYANDSAGYLSYKEVAVKKDILSPTILINIPNDNDLFGINAPSYDLSVSDGNLDSIWYSLNGGTSNSTPIPSTGTIDQTMWSLRPNGTVTIRFYANDTVGNINYEDVIVNKDIIEPSLSINSPSSSDLFGLNAPSYDLSVSDGNLDSIWYSLNGGTSNSTPIPATGTIDQTMWSLRPNGTVTIRFYANDTLGNLNFVDVIVLKDILSPIMSIIEPNNYDLFGITPPYVDLSIIDGNLDSIWYQLQNTSITTFNYTWEGFIAQSVWEQVGNGTVILRFFANDTIGNLGYAEAIVYKDIYLPIITILNPTLNDVYNGTAPIFSVTISGSNLDSTWYTLDDGIINYNFTGLTGRIDQLAWTAQADGTVTIKFYINNTLGVIGFDEIDVIKDTIAPQFTLNLPINNTYCGFAPIINVLVADTNLDTIWYEVNTDYVLLANNINQQLDASIWNSLIEGEFYIYIYANDSARNLCKPLLLRLYKDTTAPSAPNLISFPQGEVTGNLLFEWEEGSDPSGILKYRLIIDNEANPFATPGFVFEINITGSSYTFTGTLQPGTYYFFLYQIDGVGYQSSASTGNFSIRASNPPSEFPIWIIFVVIGAAIGGVVGIVVLKKSKSKKQFISQIPEKKPVVKTIEEVPEDLSQLDYDVLKVMNHDELNSREENLLEYIRNLEENKKYAKAAEFIGELIIIEEILGNSQEAKLYRQKQIDIAVKGLEYLKEQYEVESKSAAVSGDYSKALELYNESKLISDNLKGYIEQQESFETEENINLDTFDSQLVIKDMEIVYSCINDLLTKYFDDIGIKYYSYPQLYNDTHTPIHGLIFADQFQIEDIDLSVRKKIKSIQIIYTEDVSNENLTKLCQVFHNQYALLFIVGIEWPKNIEAQIIEIPPNIGVEHQENIRIIHHDLFSTFIGLEGVYKAAFNEIIDLYHKSELDILQETHDSSEIIIHSTDELQYDLKEKGLIKDKLEDYFQR